MFNEGVNCVYTYENHVLKVSTGQDSILRFTAELPEKVWDVVSVLVVGNVAYCAASGHCSRTMVYQIEESGEIKTVFNGYFPNCQSILEVEDGFVLLFRNRIILFDSEFNMIYVKLFYVDLTPLMPKSSAEISADMSVTNIIIDHVKGNYGVVYEIDDSTNTRWFPLRSSQAFSEGKSSYDGVLFNITVMMSQELNTSSALPRR